MARAKTEQLPGIKNGKIIKEVSEAAEQYEKIRDQRMKLTEKEVEANQTLASLLKKHKLKAYRDDDYDPPLIAWLPEDPKIKAKVRREKVEEE